MGKQYAMTEKEFNQVYGNRPANIFSKFVKGDRNLFSPYIVEYGFSEANPEYVYEISWGNGIFGNYYVAGATIVHVNNGHLPDLGQCFYNDGKRAAIAMAKEYVNSLK